MSSRVYIAGPYTQGDVAQNVRNAIHAADELLKAGYTPYVPHLTHFWHLLSPKPYGSWLALDVQWLRQCHLFLRLPGPSPGADHEEAIARELGFPIFHSLDDLFRRNP